MARRKRKKTNIHLPRDREETLQKIVREDADDLIGRVGDLDIDEAEKDYICDAIEDISNMTIALLGRVNLPKRGLPYPWDEDMMN